MPPATHDTADRGGWWAMRDSNPRPPRCKRDALPAELIALGPVTRAADHARMPAMAGDAGGQRAAAARAAEALVEFVSEPLAGLEFGLLRGGDPDLLAGARIAAFRGGATGHREGPEPHETNLATPLQCTGDRLEHRFDRLIGSRL